MVSEELSHEEFEEIRLGLEIADKLGEIRMKRTYSKLSRDLAARALERASFKDTAEKIRSVGRVIDRRIRDYIENVSSKLEELYVQYNEVKEILFYRKLEEEYEMAAY